MTPDEARSLGRAIRAARLERGLSQLKLAVAIGVSGGQVSIWERGNVSAARGRPAYPPTIPRDRLEAIASTLDCTVAAILDRAALTAATRVLYGGCDSLVRPRCDGLIWPRVRLAGVLTV